MADGNKKKMPMCRVGEKDITRAQPAVCVSGQCGINNGQNLLNYTKDNGLQ